LEAWLHDQHIYAFNQILANIGPNGANARGTAPGCILASPSRHAPNYYYQWIRDGGIVISSLVEQWQKGKWPKEEEKSIIDRLLKVFMDYVDIQKNLQWTNNPSGGFYDGGLGEPKFNADGSGFTGNWGRPQRDGPALRTTAIINVLRAAATTYPILLTDYPFLRKLYEPSLPATSIIKADLEYVAHTWPRDGFDLWEEVNGVHFFTAMVQLKALEDGASLARKFGDPGAADFYEGQAKELGRSMWKFWDERRGHLVSTVGITSRNPPRSGLNCDLMLGALHGNGKVFPPWSWEVLTSLEKLVRAMNGRYPNRAPPRADGRPSGSAIGRYTEDVYDGIGTRGGHAWFICTASVARVLYASVIEFSKKQKFDVTPRNLQFFRMINPQIIHLGEIEMMDDRLFNETVRWMFEYADGFMDVVRRYVSEDGKRVGHMAEQFDVWTGRQLGARDLTWSYGSFLTAVEERGRARAWIWG
ncbi:Six-hairpin glycosidase-like protein, partial [Terfezia claveryi]